MQKREYMLLGLLASVAGLYWWSRTQQGAAVVDGAATETLDFVAVTATRIKNAVVSRGYRNNNPGNIEWIENPRQRWRGMVSRDGRYGVFDTPASGTRALGGELKASVRKGQQTVRAIIYEWAPPGENNTEAYVRAVAKELRVDPDARIDVMARAPELARAIARHENGYVDSAYDWNWVYLA